MEFSARWWWQETKGVVTTEEVLPSKRYPQGPTVVIEVHSLLVFETRAYAERSRFRPWQRQTVVSTVWPTISFCVLIN